MLSKVAQVLPRDSALVETLTRAHLADDDNSSAEAVYQEHVIALEQARFGDRKDAVEQLRLDTRR